MHEHIRSWMPNRDKEAAKAKRRFADLEEQRAKLMTAHYAEAVPIDLLKAEQARIAGELTDAQQSLDRATRAVRRLEAHVDAALDLLTDAHAQYLAADHTGRLLMNQAVFEAIWIGDDDIEAAQMRPGLAELVSDDLAEQLSLDRIAAVEDSPEPRPVADAGPGARLAGATDTRGEAPVGLEPVTDTAGMVPDAAPFVASLLRSRRSECIPGREKNLRHARGGVGSKETVLVGQAGLEPATDGL